MLTNKFNIRVYGLLINNGQLLVSDEYIKGKYITKFPGGGLEFGEGIIDCVKREFKEELAIDIFGMEHFYTTDFYQASAFKPNEQIISIYYKIKTNQIAAIQTQETAFAFAQSMDLNDTMVVEKCRWISLEVLSPSALTLPIDRVVVNKILEELDL